MIARNIVDLKNRKIRVKPVVVKKPVIVAEKKVIPAAVKEPVASGPTFPCLICKQPTKVIDSRNTCNNNLYTRRRRRECTKCKHRFTTQESSATEDKKDQEVKKSKLEVAFMGFFKEFKKELIEGINKDRTRHKEC